ncbi:BglG family transcription antiterminator LicT [Mediterraneibacter gnavus]|uniref:BglG family transcription antiterminator LicT n=1 Tax=Mediterraneibacter gnavus TaxID=33038 RepID=UPI00232C1392|nr:PRD domain-containing protein [Mediterraneibacter gnavus]MDB8711811.1 PRD domain-containing protein [Mediterraneibacter gnavus]MDB8713555.1 PRD domain-containing protein [Mediterraneibacter gnavus]
MIIKKVLNNNVLISLDDQQQEVIVMGRGIGYQKKSGDSICNECIDKTFVLKNSENHKMLQKLVLEVPLEFIQVTEEIVTLAKQRLGKPLNESIYITLTDHIHSMVQRLQDGLESRNLLLWDIKQFYRDEFRVGQESLSLLEEHFRIPIPADEAGFIALHIVNAELNTDIKAIYDITKIIHEITNIVRYYFRIRFDEESIYYHRFLTHLKFFAKRLESGLYPSSSKADELFLIVKEKYKNSFQCAEKIGDYIQSEYHVSLTEEEKVYLTIHIERIVMDSHTRKSR